VSSREASGDEHKVKRWVRVNLFLLTGIVLAIYATDAFHDAGTGRMENPRLALWVAFGCGWWMCKVMKKGIV
jgi:hypothetical protein